jgi:hypothetical protein
MGPGLANVVGMKTSRNLRKMPLSLTARSGYAKSTAASRIYETSVVAFENRRFCPATGLEARVVLDLLGFYSNFSS